MAGGLLGRQLCNPPLSRRPGGVEGCAGRLSSADGLGGALAGVAAQGQHDGGGDDHRHHAQENGTGIG